MREESRGDRGEERREGGDKRGAEKRREGRREERGEIKGGKVACWIFHRLGQLSGQ